MPAVTACAYGKGLAVYSGAYPSEALLDQLWPRLLPEAARLPADVERIALDDGVLWLNHSEQPATVRLPGAWRDRLTNEEIEGECVLLGLGVRWLVPVAAGR